MYVSKFWNLNFTDFTCSTIWCEDESTYFNWLTWFFRIFENHVRPVHHFKGVWTTPGLVGDTGKRECPTWTFPEAKVDGWKFGITRLDCMKWFSYICMSICCRFFYSEMAINQCFWMEIMVFAFWIYWFGWLSNGSHGEHKTHTCKNRCGAWKETPFLRIVKFNFHVIFLGSCFYFFDINPRGHPKKPVFFAVKLVWNGWLLNLFCFRENPPNKNPYLFCLNFKPKEIWLEKIELHLWVQGFWSQNELQKEDHDIIPLSFLTAVPFELWYWTTVR